MKSDQSGGLVEAEWYPENDVIAVMPDSRCTTDAISELTSVGFHEEDIAVYDADELDSLYRGKHCPWLKALIQSWEELRTEAGTLFKVYVEAANAGQTSAAVHTHHRSQVPDAHAILARHGGQHIRYFGHSYIEELKST